jgi:hypothetical protein
LESWLYAKIRGKILSALEVIGKILPDKDLGAFEDGQNGFRRGKTAADRERSNQITGRTSHRDAERVGVALSRRQLFLILS